MRGGHRFLEAITFCTPRKWSSPPPQSDKIEMASIRTNVWLHRSFHNKRQVHLELQELDHKEDFQELRWGERHVPSLWGYKIWMLPGAACSWYLSKCMEYPMNWMLFHSDINLLDSTTSWYYQDGSSGVSVNVPTKCIMGGRRKISVLKDWWHL